MCGVIVRSKEIEWRVTGAYTSGNRLNPGLCSAIWHSPCEDDRPAGGPARLLGSHWARGAGVRR